jgi:hypothetical protein
MRATSLVRTAIASAVVLVAACSSTEKATGPGRGSGAVASTTTTSTTSTTSTAVGPCDAPGYGGGEKAHMVEYADVDVVDGNEQILTDYFVTLCGLDICENGKTDKAGHARIERYGNMKKPAIKLGDGCVHVKMAIPAPESAQDITFSQPVYLPELPKDGATLTPGQTATSGDVSVTLEAKAVVTFEDEHYPTKTMQELRAVPLPVDKVKALVASEGLDLAWGVGPQNTHVCPPAKVSVPNSEGWAAGQEVDFYFHGVNTEQDFAPYAGWTKIAGGQVSADGKTIETAAGEGFPILGVFGLKRR